MRLMLLCFLVSFSFISQAQEVGGLPDWARYVPEQSVEVGDHHPPSEFEHLSAVLQPRIKAAAIEWLRSQFCAKSLETITARAFASDDTLLHTITQILVAQAEYEFLSRAFTFLLAGADITQVTQLTLHNMITTFTQNQTENIIATVISKNTQDGFWWRTTKSMVRTEIASFLIKAAKTRFLPAFKAHLIDIMRTAIAAQQQEDKRIPKIFKQRTNAIKGAHLNDDSAALSYERSPIRVRLKWLQKSTR